MYHPSNKLIVLSSGAMYWVRRDTKTGNWERIS